MVREQAHPERRRIPLAVPFASVVRLPGDTVLGVFFPQQLMAIARDVRWGADGGLVVFPIQKDLRLRVDRLPHLDEGALARCRAAFEWSLANPGPGASPLLTRCVSTTGTSSIRIGR